MSEMVLAFGVVAVLMVVLCFVYVWMIRKGVIILPHDAMKSKWRSSAFGSDRIDLSAADLRRIVSGETVQVGAAKVRMVTMRSRYE